jgi:hypothetical protein
MAGRGRGILGKLTDSKVTPKQISRALNKDNGLLRERLKILGLAALQNVITKKRLTSKGYQEVTNSLISVRNKWVVLGPEDKREAEQFYDQTALTIPSRRGPPRMTHEELL